MSHTFDVIESGDLCRVAAAFTFGREDLLPEVFQKIVAELDTQVGGNLADFKFYLLRHVESRWPRARTDGGPADRRALRP